MTTAYNLLKGLPKIQAPRNELESYRYDVKKTKVYFEKVVRFAEYKGYKHLKSIAKSALFHYKNPVFVEMFVRQIETELGKIYIKG